MNTFTGPFRLMMKEMSMTFYINTAITFVLFSFFNLLGFIELTKSGAFLLFGPFFFVFMLYPFVNFKGYDYILSFGGTRKQFVLAFYLSALIYGVISVVFLNLLYYLSININKSSSLEFYHLANFVSDANWIVYLWVDFSWILFVFSLGMIAKTVWFNYGTLFSLAIATLLLLISIIMVVFGDISRLIEVIFNNYTMFITSLFGLSLVFLLLSYSIMKKAPLEKGSRLIFKQKVKTI